MRLSGAKILFWGFVPLLALGALLTLNYPKGGENTPDAPEPPAPVEITVASPKTEEIPAPQQPPEAEAGQRPPALPPSPQTLPPQPQRPLPPRQVTLPPPPMALLPPQPHPTGNPAAVSALAPAAVAEEDAPPAPAAVYDFGEVDAAPRPRTPIRPVFPLRARREGVSGTVLLEFIVDESGTPRGVRIASATPPGYFEQAALAAVANTFFTPAVKDRHAVPCKVTLPLVFQMQE